MIKLVCSFAVVSCTVLAFAVFQPITARADSGSVDDQLACTPDVFRLCASEIPDEDRIVKCLNRKMASLSPACRQVMEGSAEENRRKKRAS